MIKITELARGNWKEIYRYFGVSEKILNGKNGPCPLGTCEGGTDRFWFANTNGEGVYVCRTCGSGNGFQFIKIKLGIEFSEAADIIRQILSQTPLNPASNKRKNPIPQDPGKRINDVWDKCERIKSGDCVDRYLTNRGIKKIRSKEIYIHPNEFDPGERKYFETMILPILFPTGRLICLHRTYLDDGQLANVKAPRKKMTPIIKTSGSAIRLFQKCKDSGTLAIGEGLETCLAVKEYLLEADIPIWCVMDVHGMASFVPPGWCTKLLIYADNDLNRAGQKSAIKLKDRLIKEGRFTSDEITIYLPDVVGHDFLDQYLAQKGGNAE